MMHSMRRVVVFLLVVLGGLLPTQASASELSAIISKAAKDAPAAQARPNARGQNDDNPYFLPAVVIMGGGALVALYGMTHDTGIECKDTRTSFSCGTTKSKATIFAGVGLISVGVYLYYKGKQQQNSSPQILFGPHMIGVRQHLTW